MSEEPWELLASQNAVDRLRGARLLTLRETPSAADAQLAEQHRRTETDYFVRKALSTFLGPEDTSERESDWTNKDKASVLVDVRDVEAEAIEQITQMILHELKPLVGRLDDDAANEFEEYEGSRTQHDVMRIRGLLEAIKNYGRAAAAPNNIEFDLTEAVSVTVAELRERAHAVVLARDEPVPVIGDWSLIEIAFQNGLCNAGESTGWAPESITVNWSRTDRDFWIAVIDQGKGMRGDPELAFRPGATTKDDHDGFGLTNARRSMASISGTVALSTAGSFGARFEVRWPFPPEFQR